MAGKCRTINFCSGGAEVSGEHRLRWGRSENCSPVGNNYRRALHDGAKYTIAGIIRPRWGRNNYVPAAQYYHPHKSLRVPLLHFVPSGDEVESLEKIWIISEALSRVNLTPVESE